MLFLSRGEAVLGGETPEFLGYSSLALERELNFTVSNVGSLPCDLLFFPLPCCELCPLDSPWLEQPEVQLLLQTVINVLLPPRIISTSRSKNFMLESSPAHCSTPGDASKDLRREGLAESTSQAAYLGRSYPYARPPHIHTHLYIYTHTQEYIYMFVCVYIYVYMYVCVYTRVM